MLCLAGRWASRHVLVPVRPEYFATIGFPLLHRSLEDFKGSNPGHEIDVLGVVINDACYDGGNQGGPERKRAMAEIQSEAAKHDWRIFKSPKMMRGDYNYIGNARMFYDFEQELRRSLSEEGYLS